MVSVLVCAMVTVLLYVQDARLLLIAAAFGFAAGLLRNAGDGPWSDYDDASRAFIAVVNAGVMFPQLAKVGPTWLGADVTTVLSIVGVFTFAWIGASRRPPDQSHRTESADA